MNRVIGTASLHLGDCLEVLRSMADNSVDSIVTDPPYGLNFMGKKWDYDVPSVEIWAECLRVIKPGGHLLAFAGTRTQHRMACRIEDAGFEIRDMIAWVYGSGFPKSLDVSKAIDKVNGETGRLHKFTAWMRTTGVTARQLDAATGTNMGGHYLTAASQPAIPTAALWELIRQHCGDVPPWVDELVQRIEAEREVVGHKKAGIANPEDCDRHTIGGSSAVTVSITAPATPEAQQWAGWGTALKPALEPITVARKPLIGTVAANVLAHGTGAINVDACRVPLEEDCRLLKGGTYGGNRGSDKGTSMFGTNTKGLGYEVPSANGRWPANLIHDGSADVVSMFPQSAGQQGDVRGTEPSSVTNGIYGDFAGRFASPARNDTGSAARFFYCAKASRADRNDGVEHLNKKPLNWSSGTQNPGSFQSEGTDKSSQNNHPTVKPTDLMAYLCRLVTPAGGIVLDPFMGSGSTGRAAGIEQFKFIGIEINPEYFEIACLRIDSATAQQGLEFT